MYSKHLAHFNSTFSFTTYHIHSPLNLHLFKNQSSLIIIRKSLAARFKNQNLAIEISQQLTQHQKYLYKLEKNNQTINSLQKSIKQSIKQKNQIEKLKLLAQIGQWKIQKKQNEEHCSLIGKKIEEAIMKIGNLIGKNVPISNDEADNQILRVNGKVEELKECKTYSQIMEEFGFTDLKRGQKVGGHRGYFLMENGVRLALALISYAIDFLSQKGYTIYQSPAIITEDNLKSSCQLQTIKEDVYKLDDNKSCLIGTSQQSLAALYREQVLLKSNLPVRMGGYSTCFRKQAGAHGKDIYGLFRVHQFEKIEQFSIVEADKSEEEMERMIGVSEEFYESLGIPFRVVNIVSGELNDAASQKYDLEAWYPSQKRYRQLVSVSNCTEYQSRLLKTQYLGDKNQLKYPHFLNGTLIAVQRTMTCLVEHYFRGSHIQIPLPLQKYTATTQFQIKNIKK